METNGWIYWLINLKISHWVLWKWMKSPLKSTDITLPTKGLSRQGYGFSNGHVWMWELDGEESWMPKNWCFWTVVLEKTEVLATSCEELTHWERPWCWKGLGQEQKEMTEDEMAGWHHQLDGHEFEKTPGVGDEQGGLACCDSWGRKGSEIAECLNWTELNEKKQRLFIQSLIKWRSEPPPLAFWQILEDRGGRKLCSKKTKDRMAVGMTADYWHEEAEDRLYRHRVSYVSS